MGLIEQRGKKNNNGVVFFCFYTNTPAFSTKSQCILSAVEGAGKSVERSRNAIYNLVE